MADIDPDSPNFEYWSSLQEGVFSCSGSGLVSSTYPTGIGGGVLYNVAIYWSGQPTREMQMCIRDRIKTILNIDLYEKK